MAEATEPQTEGGTPQVIIEEPVEEGPAAVQGEAEDKMDTT
jgi:hypothetical protein